ncbi:integration host factor subunit beta [Methylobacterium pseudosasicola]|uniref:Integration host factor subunit beta n=2 Tax=Methylobacterium pseudosasicola TaxID=582667 RepID=A0A1I4UF76_9HYPH|nr:integration host factor subunit beta [Methylobacterium pseudosasicola]
MAEQSPHLYEKRIGPVILTIIPTMSYALARGERVELHVFGAFEVTVRVARSGRDPRTGETVQVEARASVHFNPGEAMGVRLKLGTIDTAAAADLLRKAS